ncbi:hypothetical protein [Microcoleus sp. M2_C6]|uniref:hypothetical protein n=1 Tax=unclassified Microcoleus TaxID=2642155 RepID=UPI002FCEA9D7
MPVPQNSTFPWGVGVGLLARPQKFNFPVEWASSPPSKIQLSPQKLKGKDARSTKFNFPVGSRGWASSPP